MKKLNENNVQGEYGKLSARYKALVSKRRSLEGMWRDCSALTLPYIFPIETKSESKLFDTPYNSIGPSSVNTLAAKLLLALLPASGNFFRLIPFEEAVQGMSSEELSALDKELAKIEKAIVTKIDVEALRVPLFEAFKILIVTGNVMLMKTPKGMKVFNPYEYVVSRDYVGNIIEIVIKERISVNALPANIRAIVEDDGDDVSIPDEDKDEKDIYTVILRSSDNKFISWQEIDGKVLPNTFQTYKEDELPYIVLRWSHVFNESYGRGLVEQYIGDFRSLEGLTKTILDGSGVAAKFVFGLRPSSFTKLTDLQEAANGDIISGDLEKDVTVLNTNKAPDLQIPFNLMQQLEQRISRAFLNIQGGVRDSERTTAVEVRATIAELESALGGTYSVLAQELQLPLIRLMLDEVEPKAKKITSPSIVTGASAISRERDLQNLNALVGALAQFGDAGLQDLNIAGYIEQVATALGIDPEKVVKTPEQKQAEQQQAMAMQQQMMAQQTAGQVQVAKARK